MSSTPSSRSRFRQFNDLGSKRGSNHMANRHSSYIPPSQPLDVLSLLTPSAKSKYSSGSPSVRKSTDVPSRRISSSSSVTRTVYSVKTSDGSEVKSDAPVKKNIFGRSSIYGALEAALGTVDDNHTHNNKHDSSKNTLVNEQVRKTIADEKCSEGQVVYRRKLPQNSDRKLETHGVKQERQKSVSLDVEEAFPSLRSRIQSFDSLKAKATKRVLPHTPVEEEPKLTIRRVSFEHVAKPESVCLKKDSDDSGCDENFEDSQAGTPTPSHRVASITSIDSLLGPGSPRTSSTSPDLIPKKLSNLVANPTLEECKENVFSDVDLRNGSVKKGVDLDDSIEFVTVEAPVQLMPLKKNPPKLVSDEGVFESKFFTNEKILEKKISNTKLLSNSSPHVEDKGFDKKSSTKKLVNKDQDSKSKVSLQDEITKAFDDSPVNPGPFNSNEKVLDKFINNTRKINKTAPIPIKGNETSDRNSFYRSEKIVEKKVRNTKPVTSEDSTHSLFAESQRDRIGERFTANERIMNKLISNTRKTESIQPVSDKQSYQTNESESSAKVTRDDGKKRTLTSKIVADNHIEDDKNPLQKAIESKKLKESFSVNDKTLNKFIKNTKPPKPTSAEAKNENENEEPVSEEFCVNEKILNKYITNTKRVETAAPPASKNKEEEPTTNNEEPTAKQMEEFTINDKILNKYVKNTKPPKALLEKVDDTSPEVSTSIKGDEDDEFNTEFQTGGKIFGRLLNKSKQWESSPALLKTESTPAMGKSGNFKVNENSLDKYVKNTKPPKTVSTSPSSDKSSAKYKEWEEAEVAKDPLNMPFRRKTPPSDQGDNKSRKIKKPPVPSDDTSPVTPLSPLVAKIEVLATSPVSSSDESDADWKKKIMSSQNLLQRGVSAPTLLRPLVATIMEGISDVSDTEDVLGELPSFKPAGHKAKFGRQYSTPVQSPRKEQSVPLQPARRRKSHVKTRRKSQQKQPPPKPPTIELEQNFDSLDDLTSPVLQSPFKNAIRPNRRTTTSQNPVRLRQELEKQRKEQEEKENVLKKRAEPKNPGAVSHWKKARLAASAINGLQMKIDFASAARGLRKTEKRADGTAKVSKAAGEESCVESKFPEKMLLLLKGRKNVQCALVECKVSSLNSGDVFLLLHKDELFHFVGQDANVHEKAKGNDLVERIIRNKEMGCTATKCTSLLEKDMDMCNRSFKRFFELLGGRPPIAEKESVIEDKDFERRFQQEARVSVYEDDEDTPSFVELNTGKRLKYDILDSNKTFVLDFITEYYIWCGKGVPLSVRKKALQLAEEEYKKSVAECPKNPIVPPQGRRASVAMTAGALPTTEVSRRISCASRGSIDMPSSVKLARRTSTSSMKNLTQRSISSDNVNNSRRVSVSVNSRGSISKVNSDTNLRRMSSTSTSSGERRQSVASQSGRRMSTASRRSSVVSNGRGSSSRRGSLMSTCSVDSSGQTQGRRVSVSMKQLRSLVTGSGKRIQTEQGALQVERAEWGINTVTIQGKEPISLREKFSDWPEPGRIIKMKGHAASDDQNKAILAPSQPLEPYDAELMHRPQPAEEILKLELTKLGRGRGTFKSFDEEITVVTDDVKTWLVHEYRNYVLPSSYHHMLYANEGYVVRWEYHLEVYDGFVRKHKSKRCAYYFWQGVDCKINEKGATALMTVELDKEKGPQVRVVQNREPPSFLNLFNGKLVVRTDKRQMLDREPNLGRRVFPSETEMYVVRGECVEEGHLHQVEARVGSLRSRGCFVVVTPSQTVYVWLGSKSTPHAREVAQKAGNEIEDNYISDNFRVVVVHESQEPSSFFSSLGGHEDYSPLISSIDSHMYTPRLFRFDSTSGKFVADEILCKHRVPDRDTQFPFIQDDLYGASQPALFLLDAKYQLWLWQGWFETAEDSEKVTGSARQTFARNKKVAMETVNNYVEEMMLAENPKVFPIEAGYEPLDFITLFPFWTEREDVKRFGNQAIAAKGAGGRRTSINTAYKMLTRTEYSLEELQQETKPEGVDPSKLEEYLSEEEFMKVFEMHREEFKSLAKWKQVVLKQRKKLY